jgi:murein DD-endopeptidase MepM/ murein hydrolase activator NlpD
MGDLAQAVSATETAINDVRGAVPTAKSSGPGGWLRHRWGPGRTPSSYTAYTAPSSSKSKRRSINPHRGQFSLLVTRGDGMRVIRFNFARPLAVAGFVAVAAAATMVGALVGDWLQLRQLTRESVTFAAQIAEQRKTIDDFNRRVADLRNEVGAWREMHARIQEPFGPEAGRASRDRGIGGATTPSERLNGPSASEELNRLTETIMQEGENLRALDRLMARAGKALAALPSRWPVRGSVNSEFGNRKSPWTQDSEFHAGIDIGANRGTPVQAPAAGTVFFAGTAPEYGTTVIIDHGQDIKSLYGHLSQVSVKAGQKVERGTLIAYTGNTGRSSGPHLHYEILVKGHAVNPRAYLWD